VTTPRVLVIEDNALVSDIWREFLTLRGYDVAVASDGEEALALFETGLYDLVLTDLLMPGMSGWHVVEEVRRRMPGTPVVLITGSATGEDSRRAEAEGITILDKPIDLVALEGAVRSALAPCAR
jgi:CheY-like chemotaxis protein